MSRNPSSRVIGIEIIAEVQFEFFVCLIVIVNLDPINVSLSWQIILIKSVVIFTIRVSESKDGHNKILVFIHALNIFFAINYCVIDFVG